MTAEAAALIQQEIRMNDAEFRLRSLKIKRWLRTNETALYLGTSEGAIRNKVMRGQLRSKKVFGRNYFDREEIDKLLESSSDSLDGDRRNQWRFARR